MPKNNYLTSCINFLMIGEITIKDIAKLVGVSTATVSNYLNGNLSRMSDKTQQRLQEVIASTAAIER